MSEKAVKVKVVSVKAIYAFNIVMEAKAIALVIMTKKFHPDWSDAQVEEFLKNAVEYAVEKELKKNE